MCAKTSVCANVIANGNLVTWNNLYVRFLCSPGLLWSFLNQAASDASAQLSQLGSSALSHKLQVA